MENSKSKKSNTGWKGIYFRKDSGKFKAYIQKIRSSSDERSKIITRNTRQIVIGEYDTLKEAIKARENFITNLF